MLYILLIVLSFLAAVYCISQFLISTVLVEMIRINKILDIPETEESL